MREKARKTEVREFRFGDDGAIPNNPTLPLLVYPQVLAASDLDPSRCKELLSENGWGGAWVNSVFPYHHYHSTSHEVLCVVGGSASITFGGPEGETIEVSAGDAVVIPAGVGHRNEDSDGELSVIGAYPRGKKTTTRAPAKKVPSPYAGRGDSARPFRGSSADRASVREPPLQGLLR
jgi:uncharacterized protein YjlB